MTTQVQEHVVKQIQQTQLPYKQKIWLEKYLAKSTTNHFDEIKFGGSRVPMYNKIALNLRLAN